MKKDKDEEWEGVDMCQECSEEYFGNAQPCQYHREEVERKDDDAFHYHSCILYEDPRQCPLDTMCKLKILENLMENLDNL